MRGTRWLVLVLVLALLCLPLALPYTAAGTRLALAVAQRVSGLQIDYRGGTLAGALQLASLRLDWDAGAIVLRDVQVAMDASCLWDRAICVRHLAIARTDILLEPDSQAAPAASTQAGPLRLPWALHAPDIELGAVQVRWRGGRWSQGAARVALSAQDAQLRVASAQVAAALLEIDASQPATDPGRLSLPALDLPMDLRVESLSVAPAVLVLGDNRHTLASLQLSGRWSGDRLTLRGLSLDAGSQGQLALTQGQLRFAGEWPLSAALALQSRELLTQPLLRDRRLQLEVDGDLGDLTIALHAPGAPSARGRAQVDALAPDLPFEAELEVDALQDLNLPRPEGLPGGLAVTALQPPLQVAARGTLDSQHIQLEGSAQTVGYGTVAFALGVRHSQDRFLIESLDLRDRDGGNQLSASGELSLQPALRWSLRGSSQGLALAPLSPQLRGTLAGGFNSRGRVEEDSWQAEFSEVELRGNINAQPATVSGAIRLGDGAVLPGTDLRANVNEARLWLRADAAQRGAAQLDLEIDDLARWQADTAGRLLVHAQISASGDAYQVRGVLEDARHDQLSLARATVEASYRRDQGQDFDASVAASGLRLGATALDSVDLAASGDAQRQRLQLRVSGDLTGELDLNGSGDRQDWRAELRSSTLRLQLPAGTELQGDLHGNVAGRWPRGGAPRGSLALATDGVLLSRVLADGQRSETQWERVELEASTGDAASRLAAALYRGSQAELRLQLGLEGAAPRQLDGRLSLQDMQLAPLLPLLPMLESLSGALHGELQLSGTLDEPRAVGAVTLRDGELLLTGNPTPLQALQLDIEATDGGAALRGSGLLGGGALNLRGNFTAAPLSLALQVQGREHHVFYPPSTQLLLSEALQISLRGYDLDVRGDVTVHEGELQFEQLPEGGVDLSPDVVRIDIEAETLEQNIPLAISMDLGVHIEDGFAITGKLVDSTLSGDLRLRRAPRQPLQLFGSLQTAGGNLRAFEPVLAVKRGVVSFNGNPNNPLVDLRAERIISAENIVAGVHVHGALEENLTLDVYSDPVMSPGDAMSYLIWGRSVQTGNTGDGTVVALSLAGSVVNRSSLVESINRVPGISDVSFGAEGSEDDAAATVSGYIGQRIYLSYGFGIYEPVNILTARLFLQSRLWLEVVSRLENSADLYYSFDID